ncbi:hypothetical protein H6P81_001099 [Aristolochia fimbriata]|uniref:Disease resistance RPP13-like protein 4 n=1 Tax=Aristolochia fimbriata TaxID=158543 RepID=A0AAV7F770_ARIFI|nr:hypothetical protein H6P81_001099 [Aristolochia fimbriata]
MADAVVSVFLERLLHALIENGRKVIEFQEQFERMKRQLQLMQSFLKDADRQKRKNQSLRTIIDSLRELIYDAEDILADCQVRRSKYIGSERNPFFSPSELLFRSQAGQRLREINKKVGEIKEDIRSFLLPPLIRQSGGEHYQTEIERWSSPVFDQSQIVGLEDGTKMLKGWLLRATMGLTLVGIVGMGGLGKSTAAQRVFNDREIEFGFERRIWVSVSQTFNEEEIMRTVLKSLGETSMGDTRGELLTKIHQNLSGRRYLIVMDDVWGIQNGWWARLENGLPKEDGSAVIITTRNEGVARRMGVVEGRVHRPRLLTEEESWSLLCKIAFVVSGGVCRNPELEKIGFEVVEKCGGLPLAIKAIGGALRCRSPSFFEWKRIAENFREELEENGDSVMASLQLSYDELPSHLKLCFLCFSLYPEDCVIPKQQLTHWWIGEGFIPMRNGRVELESAEHCLLGLMNRCLVEAVDKRYNGDVYTCKIHDMVRDLALKMAQEEGFYGPNSATSRRSGLTNKSEGMNFLAANSKLRAMLSTTKTGEVNKVNLNILTKIGRFRYLRVLDLSKSISESNLEDVVSRIGTLQHLAYLSLRNCYPLTSVPSSIKRLSNLMILDLGYCHSLRTLPSEISTMEKLIVLDVSYCGSLEYLPKGLSKLTNLQALLGFKPSCIANGSQISELRSLTQLKTLEMRITRGKELAEGELTSLLHLQQLERLTMNCFGCYGNDLLVKLDQLCPPCHLRQLSLEFFPGEQTPTWLNPTSLPKLQHLAMSHGDFNRFHSSFWGTGASVWKLEGLVLESLADLEEEWSNVQQAMPSLRLLRVSWCPNLGSFPVEEVGFKGGFWMKDE